jgi:hypothetical protein
MVERMTGNLITVACRGGKTVTVDSTLAAKSYRMAQASVGHALLARGTIDASGVLHAISIQHAFQNAKMWMPDR